MSAQPYEAIYSASCESNWPSQENRMAHSPPSFGTLLKANGEDLKTVQELLRHANGSITLDVYTQEVNSNKRAAQSKLVRMMVSDVGQKREEKYPQTTQ